MPSQKLNKEKLFRRAIQQLTELTLHITSSYIFLRENMIMLSTANLTRPTVAQRDDVKEMLLTYF